MGKMKSYILFCLITATLVFASVHSQTAVDASKGPSIPPQVSDVSIWQILPDNKPLAPGQSFSLYTSPPGEFVVYGKRDSGINLTWAKPKQQHDRGAPANFTLARASGTSEPIKYGETVALSEKTGGYIAYKQRNRGINLAFSSEPAYEWEVRGGRLGAPVTGTKQGDALDNISDIVISLYNTKINCYVVYGKRDAGINLIWKGGPRC